MAGKPDLTTAQGVQNVVVYVSNDNFAQAYAVNQQNVAPNNLHGSGFHNQPHPMAPMGKGFSEKQIKPSDFNMGNPVANASQQGGYFASVISQNGFSQPLVNNIGFQNGAVKNCSGNEVPKVREECDNYTEPYVTIMGAEVPSQSARCDSVRSEAAESSCSSLSSADDGMIIVQNQSSDMVVYDPSVSVRPPGGVMLAVGPAALPPQTQNPPVNGPLQQSFITVPYGWKRILNNGSVVYISPSNTALSSPEQVKEYLLTTGTCKCGLECHFKYDSVFNFDPKVASKPWVLSPDTNTGDLTKLCNHKRKITATAALDCKPLDPNAKLRKDYSSIKRKKRKIGLPYAAGMSVSQILAQRDKLALNQQAFNKDLIGNTQQAWPQNMVNNTHVISNRIQGYPENSQNIVRCQDQMGNRVIANSQVVMGDNGMVVQQQQSNPSSNISHHQLQHGTQNINHNIPIQHQQLVGPGGQIINIQGQFHPNPNQIPNPNPMVVQGQNFIQAQQQPHPQRVFVGGQPNEPSGPGRPNNVQMMPGIPNLPSRGEIHQRMPQPHQLYNNQMQPQFQHMEQSKSVRPYNQVINGFRPQGITNQNHIQSHHIQMQQQQQKMQWQNRMLQQQQMIANQQQHQISINQQQNQNNTNNEYERVPPLHQHTPPPTVWHEEVRRKKVKLGKVVKNRPYHVMDGCQPSQSPCPNIDVRQLQNENSRDVIVNQLPNNQNSSSPSFMEDPSGYLAQQTALLNSTINRQTGVNNPGFISPVTSVQNSQQNIAAISNTQINEVPLPSNIMPNVKPQQQISRTVQNHNMIKAHQFQHNHTHQQYYGQQLGQVQMQQNIADSSISQEHHQQYTQCQGCLNTSNQYSQKQKTYSRSSSEPGTPNSCGTSEDPVTSSMYSDKTSNQSSPDSRPIQGGTVSTSNVSPIDGNQSDPPTPNSHNLTPTPPQRHPDTSQIIASGNNSYQLQPINQMISQSREMGSNFSSQQQIHKPEQPCCSHAHAPVSRISEMVYTSGVVTAMASGRTVGSNTITSVLAGRANTATVSINSPSSLPNSSSPSNRNIGVPIQAQPVTINVTKSPLEMVQSVVSSIQVPQSQQQHVMHTGHSSSSQISPQIIKHSPGSFPSGHILVSSGGQIIMASAGNSPGAGVMAPPPPKVVANHSSMPPMSVSPMVTNVTAAVTQVIPAVAQQVLGQQTVLVNALPAPFVIQPGVTMTMDGMTVGQNMQIPQLVAGNVIQQQIQIDNADPRRTPALLSPDNKKKGKKRKMSSQTVAGMVQIAAQQNSGVVVPQQGFPQQIQMAHSPQGITTGPVMQALTIVPSKTGGPPQIVMNGQAVASANIGTQQIITNSQPTQQINLLQPVNLINGATVVGQNFPLQQFIVPNLSGSMVMNPDGTATILQDTSNIGMQLQIQNVNGQNVLTPVQNNTVFNGSQGILAAGPAGMVIRAPTSQGKIIQQQQHSPGTQFLSPNGGQFVVNGAQFSGQLSPLVASVSPTQQVTFSTSPQQLRSNNSIQPAQQEYIQMNGQMGQTLMVPCTPANNINVSSASQQNTTFVQQNTTIVQQQTTMQVSNNQQVQNNQQSQQQAPPRTATLNVDQQNFIISANDNKQVQAVVVQQRESPQQSGNYRQSVSTQTAVNQNTQAVTTNTFCQTSILSAGSPPDTTTMSPLASGGQSPPTADTTTHTGSTDDGLSPAPSNCSATEINMPGRPQSCTMAMVHCVSSSEPDAGEINTQSLDNEWRRNHPMSSTSKVEYTEVNNPQIQYTKKSAAAHMAYAESSTLVGLQFMNDKVKHQESVSSRTYEKLVHQRKNSDTLIVMESRNMHSLFEDDEEHGKSSIENKNSLRNFVIGDLIWGPTKGFPAWPGKVVEIVSNGIVCVKWFGNEKDITKIESNLLKTLSEGLDAHHQARKKSRTSRKLNTQLEKAIQEAMDELDKATSTKPLEESKETPKTSKVGPKIALNVKKNSGRLRGVHR